MLDLKHSLQFLDVAAVIHQRILFSDVFSMQHQNHKVYEYQQACFTPRLRENLTISSNPSDSLTQCPDSPLQYAHSIQQARPSSARPQPPVDQVQQREMHCLSRGEDKQGYSLVIRYLDLDPRQVQFPKDRSYQPPNLSTPNSSSRKKFLSLSSKWKPSAEP